MAARCFISVNSRERGFGMYGEPSPLRARHSPTGDRQCCQRNNASSIFSTMNRGAYPRNFEARSITRCILDAYWSQLVVHICARVNRTEKEKQPGLGKRVLARPPNDCPTFISDLEPKKGCQAPVNLMNAPKRIKIGDSKCVAEHGKLYLQIATL